MLFFKERFNPVYGKTKIAICIAGGSQDHKLLAYLPSCVRFLAVRAATAQDKAGKYVRIGKMSLVYTDITHFSPIFI